MHGQVLARFAVTLNVSADEILALQPVRERPAVKPISRKVQRRAEMLENLSPAEQKHVLRTIDILVKGVGK